jgi:hypothetical protein
MTIRRVEQILADENQLRDQQGTVFNRIPGSVRVEPITAAVKSARFLS